MNNISITLQHLAQEPAKITNMPNNRQILPGSGFGLSGLASNGSDGFNKCLTYQLAMATNVNRANQESNINRETSNPVRGNGTDSSDLISNRSVEFNKCLTYQLAMATNVNRANQESNINRETSNPVRGNGTDSSDLISNRSVEFNKCLTYQLAMAADFDRQAFFQRQILSEKTDELLES